MKKRILLAPALLIGLSLSTILPNGAFADDLEITVVNDGLLMNNRTLVPVRIISEELGSKVEWNHKNKTVTVIDGNNKKVLKANSRTITVNGKSQIIDSPVTIKDGKTYVPLLVSSPEGVEVTWDNRSKVATLTSKDKQVVVMTGKKANTTILTQISDERILELVKKVNEVDKIESISQKRDYFKPYFTDEFINQIIATHGFYFVSEGYKDVKITKLDDTSIQQKLKVAGDEIRIRGVFFKNVNGVWKVEKVGLWVENSNHPGTSY